MAARATDRKWTLRSPDQPQVETYVFQVMGFADIGPALTATLGSPVLAAGEEVSMPADLTDQRTPGPNDDAPSSLGAMGR